jgi:resuscitation-promoting factor RpfB
MSNINGFTLGYTVAGAIVMWSGITGTSLSTTVRDLISGKAPTQDQETIAAPATTTAATSTASTGTAPAGNTGASTATAAANQATARLLAAPYGWSTGTQWTDLVSLWNQESGWNNLADNPSSGAYGIAQALPPTKYPAAGQAPPVGTSSAIAQISWGLSYISSTYGSPSAAWAHEVANDWY